MTDFSNKWMVEKNANLNKLVNRETPSSKPNTITVVFSNSRESLRVNEINAINAEAAKINSSLLIVSLPRKDVYKDLGLKSEIAKQVHKAMEDVKVILTSKFSRFYVTAMINGKSYDDKDLEKIVDVLAPATADLRTSNNNISALHWEYEGKTYQGPNLSLEFKGKKQATVVLHGKDLLGQDKTRALQINIHERILADFEWEYIGAQKPLAVSVAIKGNATGKYQWNWGDGSKEDTGAQASHTYAATGKYKITLVATGEMEQSDTIVKEVEFIQPKADFQFEANCVGKETCFQNQSQDFVSCSWNFGDGSTSEENSPTHIFEKAGEYDVVLSVTGSAGVVATKTEKVVVVEDLSVDFSYKADENNTANIIFTNKSVGAVKCYWDFGDGGTNKLTNPSHKYEESRTYTVTLTATSASGAEKTSTKRVTVQVPEVQGNEDSDYESGSEGDDDDDDPPPRPINKVDPPVEEGGSGIVFLFFAVLVIGGGVFAFLKFRKKQQYLVRFSVHGIQIPLNSPLDLAKLDGPVGLKLKLVKNPEDSADEQPYVCFKVDGENAVSVRQRGSEVMVTRGAFGEPFPTNELTVNGNILSIDLAEDSSEDTVTEDDNQQEEEL